MLILENTTFRPDTLHALRNAFEPELVDQPSNKTQLKPGNYFQSLHVLSMISYHPSMTIIFNCQFFDSIEFLVGQQQPTGSPKIVIQDIEQQIEFQSDSTATSNVKITTPATLTTVTVELNSDQMMADEMLPVLIPRKMNANFATRPTSITVARKTKKISSEINSKFMPIKTKRPGFKKRECSKSRVENLNEFQ